MTLIKSISGFRGTIGGKPGDTLNPLDIVKFVSSYATLRRQAVKAGANKIVVGAGCENFRTNGFKSCLRHSSRIGI